MATLESTRRDFTLPHRDMDGNFSNCPPLTDNRQPSTDNHLEVSLYSLDNPLNSKLVNRQPTTDNRQPSLIDLQWFASPESEGRTEQPTERKLRRAREEEGRVVKSQELVQALGLLFPALSIVILAPSMLSDFIALVRFFFVRITEIDPVRDRIIFGIFVRYFLRLALPILLVAMVSGVLSSVLQSGFLWTTKPLKPKFSKIVPRLGQYLSKTVFSVNGLYNFLKSIAKMAIIGLTAFVIIKGDLEKLQNLQKATILQGFSLIAMLVAKLLLSTAILFLVLSVPDYFFQRFQFMREMQMSKLEVQEERKQEEGDPLVKSRIKQRMRQLLSQNLREAVPRADVVIRNPTHYACAIAYVPGEMEAPTLLAKGEDEMALQIVRLAEEARVPIVENKPLARAIYTIDVGETIPQMYWEAIIAILQKIDWVNRERRRVRAEA